MELRIYNNKGIKDFLDFDLTKFIECLEKEKKMLKGKEQPSIVNDILSKCIVAAVGEKTTYGESVPNLFSIEVSNF